MCHECQHEIRRRTTKIYTLLAPKLRLPGDRLTDQTWQLIQALLKDIEKQVASKETARMKPTHMIIHHSLTEDSATVSWTAIRAWHTGFHPQSPHRWHDIGYHYGIELVGDCYEVLVGRPEDAVGAHCIGMNGNSLGVCFVGNYDLAPPPDAMLARAVSVLAPVIRRNGIPFENVRPHSAYAAKSCPGSLFPMKRFVEALKRGYW